MRHLEPLHTPPPTPSPSHPSILVAAVVAGLFGTTACAADDADDFEDFLEQDLPAGATSSQGDSFDQRYQLDYSAEFGALRIRLFDEVIYYSLQDTMTEIARRVLDAQPTFDDWADLWNLEQATLRAALLRPVYPVPWNRDSTPRSDLTALDFLRFINFKSQLASNQSTVEFYQWEVRPLLEQLREFHLMAATEPDYASGCFRASALAQHSHSRPLQRYVGAARYLEPKQAVAAASLAALKAMAQCNFDDTTFRREFGSRFPGLPLTPENYVADVVQDRDLSVSRAANHCRLDPLAISLDPSGCGLGDSDGD